MPPNQSASLDGPLAWIFLNRKGIRSGWRLAAWFLLSTAGLFAVLIIAGVLLVVTGALNKIQTNGPVFSIALSWLLFLPIYLAAVLVAVVMERRPVQSLGFSFYRGWIQQLGIGIGIGAGLLTAVMLCLVCLGAYRITGITEGLAPALGWGTFMAVGFLGVGAFEEFLFRGYAFQTMVDGLRMPAAVTISCILFALLHLGNHGENPLGIASVLAAGALLLVIVIRTRSLWMALGLHAAWDWSQNFVFSVADSGVVLPGGLLGSTHHGQAWLTGGTVGPEGSVVAIVVEIAAAVYFTRAPWLRPAPQSEELWRRFVYPREEPPVPESAMQPAPFAGPPQTYPFAQQEAEHTVTAPLPVPPVSQFDLPAQSADPAEPADETPP